MAERGDSSEAALRPSSRETREPTREQVGSGAISWIATQIPEFAGSEEESVAAWVDRVNKIAQIHEASDQVTLLAASSKLIKQAKQWYELQSGEALESWAALRRELLKIFDKQDDHIRYHSSRLLGKLKPGSGSAEESRSTNTR